MMHDIVRLTEYEKYKWEKSISSESALRDIFLVAISIRLYDISRSVVPVSYDSYNRLFFFRKIWSTKVHCALCDGHFNIIGFLIR